MEWSKLCVKMTTQTHLSTGMKRLKNIQRFFQIDIGDFYRLDLKMKKVIMVELKIDIGDKIWGLRSKHVKIRSYSVSRIILNSKLSQFKVLHVEIFNRKFQGTNCRMIFLVYNLPFKQHVFKFSFWSIFGKMISCKFFSGLNFSVAEVKSRKWWFLVFLYPSTPHVNERQGINNLGLLLF